jgi:hypothetical protein
MMPLPPVQIQGKAAKPAAPTMTPQVVAPQKMNPESAPAAPTSNPKTP